MCASTDHLSVDEGITLTRSKGDYVSRPRLPLSDGWNNDTTHKPQSPSHTVLSGAMTLIRPSVQDTLRTEKTAKQAKLLVKRNVLHTISLRRRRSLLYKASAPLSFFVCRLIRRLSRMSGRYWAGIKELKHYKLPLWIDTKRITRTLRN